MFKPTMPQKAALAFLVIAATVLLLLPLFSAPPVQPQGENYVSPEVFYEYLTKSKQAAIMANISGAKTDAANTAILQCSIEIRANIIGSLGKNVTYAACNEKTCLLSLTNEGTQKKEIPSSQIAAELAGMPYFIIEYGTPVQAYYPDHAIVRLNSTLPYPCKIYSVQQDFTGTPSVNSTQPGNASATENKTSQ